jgi:hypothetical protein
MHVKKYQEQHGCSYKDALKGAKATYKRGRGFDPMKEIADAMIKKPMERIIKQSRGGSLFGNEVISQKPEIKTWGDHLKSRLESERTARLKGSSLSSMNKAYWKANRDLFDYTHKPMIAAATKLYGF